MYPAMTTLVTEAIDPSDPRGDATTGHHGVCNLVAFFSRIADARHER